jgi:hypothetical protein
MNILTLKNKRDDYLKLILTIVFATTLFYNSAGEHSKKTEKSISNEIQQEITENKNSQLDSTIVKKWLKKVIMEYINNNDWNVAHQNLKLALTYEYNTYKHEAITLEYSDMTLEEFNQKWEHKYNTKLVGNGGFFGLPQDHGNIEISTCSLLKTYGDTAQIYRVTIRDIRWETNHLQDIKIVKREQKFLIDDIMEYN